MTLQEFLATASADNAQALTEAKAYTIGEGKLIPATTVNQIFAEHDLTGVIKDISEDITHVARHKLLSVLLSIQGDHEFNFIQGTTAGNGNLLMLDWLIYVAMPEHAEKLTAFKNTMVALSNKQVQPFANIEMHDVLKVRGVCPTTQVQQSNGYIVFSTSADVPAHQARVWGFNPRTHVNMVLGNVTINLAGNYEFKMPTHYLSFDNLRVDDAYGVI